MAEMLCLEMIQTIFVPYFPGIGFNTVTPSRPLLTKWTGLVSAIGQLRPSVKHQHLRWQFHKGLLLWCFYASPAVVELDLSGAFDDTRRTQLGGLLTKLTTCAINASIDTKIYNRHHAGSIAVHWKLLIVGVVLVVLEFLPTIAIRCPTPHRPTTHINRKMSAKDRRAVHRYHLTMEWWIVHRRLCTAMVWSVGTIMKQRRTKTAQWHAVMDELLHLRFGTIIN